MALSGGGALLYVHGMARCVSMIEIVPRHDVVTSDREENHDGDHHGVSRVHSERVELSWTTNTSSNLSTDLSGHIGAEACSAARTSPDRVHQQHDHQHEDEHPPQHLLNDGVCCTDL